MATYQGAAFVVEQARTILDQEGVDVRLVVSDDGSTDGTVELLEGLQDERIVILPAQRSGGAPANFLRLVREADVSGATAIALADQDDRWHTDRLARQLALIAHHGVDAVSSSVTAFWTLPDGSERTTYVEKSQPQTELDFLLESAGPGCTFLLTAAAFTGIREIVRSSPLIDEDVPHDWTLYAIARATGRRWRIDPVPTLDYRQHGANVTGANRGVRPALSRAKRLASGHYRQQCRSVARLAGSLASPPLEARLARVAPLFEQSDLGSRMALRRMAPSLRREPAERRWLALALTLGMW